MGSKVIYLKKGFHLIDIDFVQSGLKRLKQADPSTKLAACDIDDCSFPDDSFGAYLSHGVVEYFFHDPQDKIK